MTVKEMIRLGLEIYGEDRPMNLTPEGVESAAYRLHLTIENNLGSLVHSLRDLSGLAEAMANSPSRQKITEVVFAIAILGVMIDDELGTSRRFLRAEFGGEA